MREAEKFVMLIVYWIMLAFVFSGCATQPKVHPLQNTAAEVVLKDPQNPEYWVEYGRSSLFSNNPQGAEMAFRRALQLNEKYLPSYKHLGLVLVELGRYKDAQKVYEKALQTFDKDSELQTAYGYCLVDLGNDKKALAAFRRSIELNTDPVSVVSARLGASALLRRQGDEAAALREYEEALKVNPEIIRILKEQKKSRLPTQQQ